jgi:hypothetical protein
MYGARRLRGGVTRSVYHSSLRTLSYTLPGGEGFDFLLTESEDNYTEIVRLDQATASREGHQSAETGHASRRERRLHRPAGNTAAHQSVARRAAAGQGVEVLDRGVGGMNRGQHAALNYPDDAARDGGRRDCRLAGDQAWGMK